MKQIKVATVAYNTVVADPNQPRQYFDATKLASLANSIKRIGIKEPLVVEDMKDGTYKIVDGERRFRAAKIAGLKELPVIIEEKMPESQRLLEQFHIQEQHEGWRPHEKALAIRDIASVMGMSYTELGNILGISKFTLRDYVAFINLAGHREMLRTETPMHMAYPIQQVTAKAVRELLKQENIDMTQAEQKDFQIGIMKRIKSGEITKEHQLAAIKDSLAQNAKKTVQTISKTDKSVAKLFVETNAKTALVYRQLGNLTQNMLRVLYAYEKEASLRGVLEEDITLKNNLKLVVKKINSIV